MKNSRFGLMILLAAIALAPSAPAAGNADETQKLIAVLQSDAGQYDKATACRRLAVVGTKEAVPVLAALLADEKLSHMARYALEPMPEPAVDDALRDALGKLKGNLLIGVINSIGQRRDAKATANLIDLLNNPDAGVAAAAGGALGRIGNTAAAQALQRAMKTVPTAQRPAMADACLICADNLALGGKRAEAAGIYDAVRQAELPVHIRVAGTRGAILARQAAGIPLLLEQLRSQDFAMVAGGLRVARELPGKDVTKALAGELGKLPAEKQVLLIEALGDRGDQTAVPSITEAAKSATGPVRVAAIRVLVRIGDATAVPLLLDAAVQSEAELAEAAKTALVTLPGKDVDSALVTTLDKKDNKVRLLAIEAVGQRRVAVAVPGLLRAANDPDVAMRLAALKSLGDTVGVGDLSALVELMVKARTPEEATAGQSAVSAACTRITDKRACADKLLVWVPKTGTATKCALLQLLSQVGGPKALPAVRTAAKDTDTKVQETALRALCEWPTPEALPDLLDLAKNSRDAKFKILGLRGYLRLLGVQEAPAAQKLAALKDAMPMAEKDSEKRIGLATLGNIASVDALNYAMSYLTNEPLKDEACAAAVAVAEKIKDKHPAEVSEAMRKVAKATGNKQVAKRANALVRQTK